jgi:hypothetical protein
MNKTIKTWLTISISTAAGAALGMLLAPKKKKESIGASKRKKMIP